MKHRHKLHDLLDQLRNKAHSTPLMGKLRSNTKGWNQLTSAMDSFSLSTEIILRQAEQPETNDYYDSNTIITSILQHCVMQYDAYSAISKSLGTQISPKSITHTQELRKIRKHVGAHPTYIKEPDGPHTTQPGGMRNTNKRFSYILRRPDGSSEIVNVELDSLISHQLSEIEGLFSELLSDLDNKLAEILDNWRDDSLWKYYDDELLGYTHEKIAVYATRRPMHAIAEPMIWHLLEKIEFVGNKLDERVGHRSEYPGIDLLLSRMQAACLYLLDQHESLPQPLPEPLADIVGNQLINDSEALSQGLRDIETYPDTT